MKFLHISDLHIGKTLHQESLLDIQQDALNQVLEHCRKCHINVLVIAGDIYDRSIPSSEAVSLLNSFLADAVSTYKLKVLIITGNHDSSERMDFLSDLLISNGIHIVSYPQRQLQPIVIDDVYFYLVPFFKPSKIKMLYDIPCSTYQEAFEIYLSHQNIDYSKTNVLVTHQFVAGNKEVITSESEAILSVGGSEIVDVDLFKDFDYVALGHIHACQKIKHDYIRYSGSLLKYSFDEEKQVKGMLEVTIENKETHVERVSINPLRDVRKYQGVYYDFMEKELVVQKDDYIALILEDKNVIPFAMENLKKRYPNLLSIQYLNMIRHKNKESIIASEGFETKNPVELFKEFYESVKEEKLNDEGYKMICEIIEGNGTYDSN